MTILILLLYTWSVHSKKVEGGGVLSASVRSASGITSASPMGDASTAATRSGPIAAAVRGLPLPLLLTGAARGCRATDVDGAGRRKAVAAPAASVIRAASVVNRRMVLGLPVGGSGGGGVGVLWSW